MDKHTSLTKRRTKEKKNLHHRKDSIQGNNQRILKSRSLITPDETKN
jgi:hypothetical protein